MTFSFFAFRTRELERIARGLFEANDERNSRPYGGLVGVRPIKFRAAVTYARARCLLPERTTRAR